MRRRIWVMFMLWAVAFIPQYPGLVLSWLRDSNNSHGLLVPFISAYFVWKNRSKLHGCSQCADNRGAVMLITSLIIYLLSYAGGISVVSRGMIILSFMGLILYNFGSGVFRILAFPLCFLFFMIPVPVSVISLISLPLQRLATDISAVLIRLASIPVYQEGNMLYFAQSQLEVAEACSGIHSIMALIMLSLVFVYVNEMTTKGKAVLIASAIPIALIANIVRVTSTGILAQFYGESIARGFLHEFSADDRL